MHQGVGEVEALGTLFETLCECHCLCGKSEKGSVVPQKPSKSQIRSLISF